MDQDRLYPEQFCDLTSVLPSRAAKTCQSVQRTLVVFTAKGRPRCLHVFSGGVSSRFCQGADGSTHGFVCDLDESIYRVNEPRQTISERRTHPYATSSRVKSSPSWLWLISSESFLKAAVVAIRSSGSFSVLPKILGK